MTCVIKICIVKPCSLEGYILKILVILFCIFSSFNAFALEVSKETKGVQVVNEMILSAKKDLSERDVHSRARPARGIARTIHSSVIHRLLVVENTSKNEINKVDLFGLYNYIEKYGMKKLSQKRSEKDAVGVLQITKGAFEYVKPLYKNTGLSNDFTVVSKDPVSSAKVAILFVDSSLAALEPTERTKVMRNDNLLHDYVAAAYNGGISYAMRTLRKGTDFASGNKSETREYIAKMRAARLAVPV